MEKKNNSRTYILMILGVIGTILLVVGVTYAYWILTREQTGENVVNTACLNISFTGENDINLPKAYPMTDEQLDKFLSTSTPYHFTITNECDDLANVTINLESLNAGEEKQLEDQYIDAVLYKENYKANLFKNKKLTEDVLNDENKVIKESLHAYKLYSFTLKQNEEKEFNLQLYLDQDTPRSEETMNASWKGKITLSSEYKEDRFRNSGTLRQISYSESDGMWGYKSKLTKIVIETKKEDKVAQEGETKYGPFNEGDGRTDAVVSYVICDSDEANCTGYLQSDGGVKIKDGSYLFSGFKKVTTIEGLENFDTRQVKNMDSMFYLMDALQTLDLSNWDTSQVNNMSQMFYGCHHLNSLNLENFETNNVTNMYEMFKENRTITSLNLSSFDTSKVENMISMFYQMDELTDLTLSENFGSNATDMYMMFGKINGNNENFTLDLTNLNTKNVNRFDYMFMSSNRIEHIIFGPNFVHKPEATTSNMFSSCPAPDRPTGESWDGVSFE